LEGHSHVIVALAGGVVLDSFFHISGPALTASNDVGATTLNVLVVKALFYGGIAIGGLAPDIDNARSTLGKRLGIVSKEIMHYFGHRTIMHSLIGLALWTALGYGLQQLAVHLLAGSLGREESFVNGSQTLWLALVLGYILHLFADSLTEEGIPIFWPAKWHLGFPPLRALRFRAGSWAEPVVVWALVILVALGLWQNIIQI
jgi:inner membrane protein